MAHDPRSTKQIALERDIFGQGSDLSSDEDEQRTAPRKEKNKVPRPRQDPPESSDSGGEDYVREKAKKTNKRKPRATAGDEETPKRKRKKATSPNPDVPLTAEESGYRCITKEVQPMNGSHIFLLSAKDEARPIH
ncbi:hypothetical protein FRC20_008439 [Serendipita sp. 405]|nr:hypothetical protein FRC20_008439 [Serendipita sp. 405]